MDLQVPFEQSDLRPRLSSPTIQNDAVSGEVSNAFPIGVHGYNYAVLPTVVLSTDATVQFPDFTINCIIRGEQR